MSNVSDEVAQALAADTEYRIREIIQEGMKFMHHSRRNKLTTEDLNSALRLRNVEILYGYSSRDPLRFVRVAGQKDLFYIEDNEIDLNEFVQSVFTTNTTAQTSFYKLPKVPKQTSFTIHWLAVEGIQPCIPQNPNYISEVADGKKRKAEGFSADEPLTSQTHLVPNNGGAVEIKPLVKHVLSKEQQLFYKKVTELILSSAHFFLSPTQQVQKTLAKPPSLTMTQILQATPAQSSQTPQTSIQAAPAGNVMSTSVPTSAPVATSHIPPETLAAASSAVLEATFHSIATEPGLHQLLPYFTKFISEEVINNLRRLPLLKVLMQFVRALLSNPYLHIEPYLHQLMPAILTCLVGKRLCENPFDNHWELRDFTANLVHDICKRFGKDYRDLQPRIIKTLLHAFLDPTKPMTTHYGAIVGLSLMGPLVIQSVLLPNMIAYLTLLLPELSSSNEVKRLEANKCYEALLNAAGKYLTYVCDVVTRAEKLLIRQRGAKAALSPQETDKDEGKASQATLVTSGMSDSTGLSTALPGVAPPKQARPRGRPRLKPGPSQTQAQFQPHSSLQPPVQQQTNASASKNVSMDVEETSNTTENKKPKQLMRSLKKMHGTPLQDLLPDITTYYEQLFDIFGESLLPFIESRDYDSNLIPHAPQN